MSVIDFETVAAKLGIKLPLPLYIQKENKAAAIFTVLSHQTLASLQLSFSVVICINHQCKKLFVSVLLKLDPKFWLNHFSHCMSKPDVLIQN